MMTTEFMLSKRPVLRFTAALFFLIKSRLVKFFDKNHVLYDRQYGFRDNPNVTHALLDIITHSFDTKQNRKYRTAVNGFEKSV